MCVAPGGDTRGSVLGAGEEPRVEAPWPGVMQSRHLNNCSLFVSLVVSRSS